MGRIACDKSDKREESERTNRGEEVEKITMVVKNSRNTLDEETSDSTYSIRAKQQPRHVSLVLVDVVVPPSSCIQQDREQIKGIVASIRSKLPFGKKKEEDTMDAASMEGEGAEVASQNQQARQLDEDRFVSLVPQFVEKAMEAVNHRIFQSGMAMDGDMKIHKSAVPENTQRVSV